MKKSESISCGCWSMLLGKHDTTQLKYKTNVKVVKCTALIFSEDVLIKFYSQKFFNYFEYLRKTSTTSQFHQLLEKENLF